METDTVHLIKAVESHQTRILEAHTDESEAEEIADKLKDYAIGHWRCTNVEKPDDTPERLHDDLTFLSPCHRISVSEVPVIDDSP